LDKMYCFGTLNFWQPYTSVLNIFEPHRKLRFAARKMMLKGTLVVRCGLKMFKTATHDH
jgi:hypothetical protein